MPGFCPYCGDPIAKAAHDCAAARPRAGRPLPRFSVGPSPVMVRARIAGLDPPRPRPAPGKGGRNC